MFAFGIIKLCHSLSVGAGLLARPLAEKGPESTVLLVGAVHERLLLSAEAFGLLKPDTEREMLPFTFRARHLFQDYSGVFHILTL